MTANIEKPLSKDEHILNFAKELAEVDKMMEPFREHRSDLKKMYKDNGWLTKEEMTSIAKAYRMLRSGEDISKVFEYVDFLKGKISLPENENEK